MCARSVGRQVAHGFSEKSDVDDDVGPFCSRRVATDIYSYAATQTALVPISEAATIAFAWAVTSSDIFPSRMFSQQREEPTEAKKSDSDDATGAHQILQLASDAHCASYSRGMYLLLTVFASGTC